MWCQVVLRLCKAVPCGFMLYHVVLRLCHGVSSCIMWCQVVSPLSRPRGGDRTLPSSSSLRQTEDDQPVPTYPTPYSIWRAPCRGSETSHHLPHTGNILSPSHITSGTPSHHHLSTHHTLTPSPLHTSHPHSHTHTHTHTSKHTHTHDTT